MRAKVSEKLADIYASPKNEKADDDLTFLRSMIEAPTPPSEPIDYDFLRNELSKRRPKPKKKPAGIQLIAPQTKPSTRKPKYIKPTVQVAIKPTFPSNDQEIDHLDTISYRQEEAQSEYTYHSEANFIHEDNGMEEEDQYQSEGKYSLPQKNIKTPKKYISWKYIGVINNDLGTMSGKIAVQQRSRSELSRELAELPYEAEKYKPPKPQKQPKPKIHPRDLFAISVSPEKSPGRSRGTVTALRNRRKEYRAEKEAVPVPPSDGTQLFLDTGDKLIPLCVSRLRK